MATTTEKKQSFKEQFLDMVAEKYGIAGAAAMEDVVKGHKKQVDEAMSQGMTAPEMADSMGIDVGRISVVKGKKPDPGTGGQENNQLLQGLVGKANPVPMEQYAKDILGGLPGVQEQSAPQVLPQGVPTQGTPESGVQGSKPGYSTIPASSPFGFGGATMKDGQIIEQQPGFAAGLLMSLLSGNPKTSARMDMGKLEDISKIQKNMETGGDEDQYRKLEIELKKEQLNQIRQTGTPATEEELLSNVPEEAREDFVVKPVKQTIRGIVTTVPIVERKKTLGASQLNELGGLENSRQDLGAVVERLKSSGLKIGPGLDTRPGAISDMLGQMKGSEFAALKSDIGRNFQLYRKWATGVAAGYPELNMLAPNYPKMTDNNEVFLKKSLDVMKDIERQREVLLDHYSNGGYAVSKLRNKDKQQSGGLSQDDIEFIKNYEKKYGGK
jgi:hypothetical protein